MSGSTIDVHVQSFLRFASSKRKQHLKELDIAVEDFKDTNLFGGEVYNTEDLNELLDTLKDTVRSTADKEVENAYQTGALFAHLLLQQTEQQGAVVHVDMHKLDNEVLMTQVASGNFSSPSIASPPLQQKPHMAPIGKHLLPSLGTPQAAPTDAQVVQDRDDLKEEVSKLKHKMQMVQLESTKALRERTDLRGEVQTLKDQLEGKDAEVRRLMELHAEERRRLKEENLICEARPDIAPEDGECGASGLREELSTRHQEVASLTSKLEASREELKAKTLEIKKVEETLNGKLASSKQFSTMKAMMQQKSQEVVKLRRRLAQYEPQQVADADKESMSVRSNGDEFTF